MDPQASWEQLLEAYADGDWDRVEDLAEALLTWLERDGFPPRATTGSDLGQDWDRAVALAACRFAQAKARMEIADVSQ
jgi:hypothetical protein